jgi:membrane-bound ClpP family serine protease
LISETQLSIPGQLGKFTGQEMRAWRWITHVARDEDQLREILDAATWERPKAVVQRSDVKPALIEIRGAVSPSSVGRWLRAIDEARNQDAANLLLLHIHSPGGNLAESIRLAEYLANLDESLIETVAWVDGEARGDAALIGLACDSLVMKPNSTLGGPGEATIGIETIRSLGSTWQQLSQATYRTEGELYGLLCPELPLNEFKNARGRIEFGDEQLFSKRADFQDWKIDRPIAFPMGVTAEQAVQRNLATAVVPNLLAVAQQHGLDKLPPAKRVSQLEQWIRSFADQDWLATLLLTASLMLFTNELTTPGLGLAGFLSLLCISLFFWMRFLNGTVEWLEITLCIAGILALGLEVFVLPGFGVFGFGGFIMLACGIILASQTFIVPSNEYQWKKLATSSGQIAIACVGLMTTLYLLRNQLEKLPFFRLLKLEPPSVTAVEPSAEDWSYLVGATGFTTSRCAPFGRALFGDRYFDVHSTDDLLEPETAIQVNEVRDRTIFVRRVST